jgi:hypothetical protein
VLITSSLHPYSFLFSSAAKTFCFYLAVLLVPAVGVAALIAFFLVTAGAKRSFIQMLRLECICTLPPAPASWVDWDDRSIRPNQEFDKKQQEEQQEEQQQQPKLLRRVVSIEEDHDRLMYMNEHDLAAAAVTYYRASVVSASTVTLGAALGTGAGVGMSALEDL